MLKRAVFIFFCIGPGVALHATESLPLEGDEDARYIMQDAVDRLDALLGTSRGDDLRGENTLRLGATDSWSQEHPKTDPHFHARWTFIPGFVREWQQRAQAWLTKEEKRVKAEILGKPAEGASAPHEGDADPAAAKRPVRHSPWHFNFEKHVKLGRRWDVGAQMRVRREATFRWGLLSLSNEVGWTWKHHATVSLNGGVQSHLSERWIWGFGSRGVWRSHERDIVTSHGPSLSYLLSRHQAIQTGASAVPTMDRYGHWEMAAYSLNTLYRLQFLKEKLYLGCGTGLTFPRARQYTGDWGVSGSLELVF